MLSHSSPQKDIQLKSWVGICFYIGALAFGGAGRMLMFRDAVVVKHEWLSAEEFQEIITITTLLPGPNLVNFAAYVGFKFFGNFGAMAGIFALCVPGAIMALLVIWFVPLQNPDVQRLFQGFSIGSVMLFVVYVARLIVGLKSQHTQMPATSLKFSLRLLVAVGIVMASFLSVPYLMILLVAITFCFLIEFLG